MKKSKLNYENVCTSINKIRIAYENKTINQSLIVNELRIRNIPYYVKLARRIMENHTEINKDEVFNTYKFVDKPIHISTVILYYKQFRENRKTQYNEIQSTELLKPILDQPEIYPNSNLSVLKELIIKGVDENIIYKLF